MYWDVRGAKKTRARGFMMKRVNSEDPRIVLLQRLWTLSHLGNESTHLRSVPEDLCEVSPSFSRFEENDRCYRAVSIVSLLETCLSSELLRFQFRVGCEPVSCIAIINVMSHILCNPSKNSYLT